MVPQLQNVASGGLSLHDWLSPPSDVTTIPLALAPPGGVTQHFLGQRLSQPKPSASVKVMNNQEAVQNPKYLSQTDFVFV